MVRSFIRHACRVVSFEKWLAVSAKKRSGSRAALAPQRKRPPRRTVESGLDLRAGVETGGLETRPSAHRHEPVRTVDAQSRGILETYRQAFGARPRREGQAGQKTAARQAAWILNPTWKPRLHGQVSKACRYC